MGKDAPFAADWPRIWRRLTSSRRHDAQFPRFGAVGRLNAGVTLEQARAQMDAIGKRIASDYPDSNKDWSVGVDQYAEGVVDGNLRTSLYVLFAAVGMVLLIACANLANLSLMRVVGREREIAIRVSLGAGRWALARQFLTESPCSRSAAARWPAARQLCPDRPQGPGARRQPCRPRPTSPLDGQVLLFAFALAGITGLAVASFRRCRPPAQPHPLAQAGRRFRHRARPCRVRSALVVAEVALAFVLLTGAGLLIRSLNKLGNVDPGFDSTNVLTFRLPTTDKDYPIPSRSAPISSRSGRASNHCRG